MKQPRRKVWNARIAAAGAVLVVAVLVVLASSGLLFAGSRDNASSDPAAPGRGHPTSTATVTVTRVETVQATTTQTVTVTPEIEAEIAVPIPGDAQSPSTPTTPMMSAQGEQATITESTAQAAATTQGQGWRKMPVAALKFDSGISAENETSRTSRKSETWVAGSGKGLSYTGMTTGVAIAFGTVLLIGGLVVPILARRCRSQRQGRPAG